MSMHAIRIVYEYQNDFAGGIRTTKVLYMRGGEGLEAHMASSGPEPISDP